MSKQRIIILLSFFGHLLSSYLIYNLHQRAIILEERSCVIEVRIIGVDSE